MATNPVHMATASQTHFPISSQGKFISIVRSDRMAINPVHMATASQTHFPISSQGKFISIVRSAFHLVFSRENLKVENRRSRIASASRSHCGWWVLWVQARSHLVYEFEEGDQCCHRSSKLLARMKPPPGQLKLFWMRWIWVMRK
jgi:hypothetical protein